MPSEPGMEALHREMLSLLKEFHKICMENNIKYSLHSGTLLGAIREKGFIPWDDDVDIAMAREEYEKLCKVVKENKIGETEFAVVDRLPRFVLNKNGKIIVWLDIFVYDYISEHKAMQKMKIAGCMILAGLSKNHETIRTTKIRSKYKYGKVRYLAFYFLYIFGYLFPPSWKQAWCEKFRKYCFCGNKQMIHRANDQYCGVVIIHQKAVMEHYLIIPFEDTHLMITKEYNTVLEAIYGQDYMIPQRPSIYNSTNHGEVRDMIIKR